jgi:hypothetical protein
MRTALALLLFSTTALAQPMMVDPSKMSGIPRPDPQVPTGTITVRLIRGELSNRLIGVEVELASKAGEVKKLKTDENGRATFNGLTIPGPYLARANDGVEELTSQPIALESNMGSRVMLVFQPSGGVADGVGRPDKSVPAGTIVVRAIGEGGAPQKGLAVRLGLARQGESSVKEYKGTTDDKGEASFDGLDAKPTSGYLAEVLRDGTQFSSRPFRLQENMGARVTLDVRPVSKDTAQLRIGPGSHFIFEVTDDAVQVVEMWRLMNPTTNAIDPGPNGLHLPLPDKAVQAQSGPNNPQGFTVAGHDAVLRGPIPPGDTEIQIMYVLAFEGDTLEFRQPTPLAFEDLALVTEKVPGLSVEGEGLSSEDRELQGRKLILYRGTSTNAGGSIALSFHGLPHSDPTFRYLAVAVALAFLLGFMGYAWRAPAERSRRSDLEAERERLLTELAAHKGDSDKAAAKKQKLTDRLLAIYRELDEAAP